MNAFAIRPEAAPAMGRGTSNQRQCKGLYGGPESRPEVWRTPLPTRRAGGRPVDGAGSCAADPRRRANLLPDLFWKNYRGSFHQEIFYALILHAPRNAIVMPAEDGYFASMLFRRGKITASRVMIASWLPA